MRREAAGAILRRMVADALPSRPSRAAHILEIAMTALSVVFLGLLVAHYALKLSPAWERRLNLGMVLIWGVFAVDFFVRFAEARSKVDFLRHNWLSALALALPACRIFRVLQIARAAPSVQLAGVVSGGRRASSFVRRAFGAHSAVYVGALTFTVMTLSSVGMFAVEHTHARANIRNVGDGIWWTTSTLTTIGSELYPVTVEGRILAIVVMIYGLVFAGYITATLATILLGGQEGGGTGTAPDTAALREEIRALRQQLAAVAGTAASRSANDADGVPAASAPGASPPAPIHSAPLDTAEGRQGGRRTPHA